VKVRADHAAVEAALTAAGATPESVVAQVDTYYDPPHRDFGATDEALRIRRVAPVEAPGDDPGETVAAAMDAAGSGRVTYKGPLVEAASKTREEIETGVEDAERLGQILVRLGFEAVGTVKKVRSKYRLEGYEVVLDDVVGLGSFVEVDATAAEAEIEEVREGAHDLLDSLGLDPTTQIRTSYLELVHGLD